MQPPPQAVPSGLVGPPPAGNPQSMFWSNSPYRRQVNSSAPAAPITCPLQPVTDPFAFSRQTCQNTSLGTSSKSSPPVLQDSAPPAFLQHSGQPVPHTNVRDSAQGPCEPPPRLQPRPDPSPLPSVLATPTPPGLEMRSAEVAAGSESEVQAPLYPPQYIPGALPDASVGGHLHGKVAEPDRPLSRQNLHDGAAAAAAPPFFPQALQQVPGQWGPVQGGPPPSGQPYWPCPEGSVPNSGPQAPTVSHSAVVSSLCQGPGQEHHNPVLSLPGPLAIDRRNEGVYLQSGNHSVNHFDSENAFRQSPKVGNNPAGQELRLNPGMKKEQLPALVNPLTQGNSLESHLHSSPGTKVSRTLPEVDSGGVSMFFQGGETENVENLSSVKTGSAGSPDLDSLPPNPGLGHSSTHAVAGGLYQAFLKTSGSETVQGGDAQPYFSQSVGVQHEKQATKSAAVDLWGGGASIRAPGSSGPQYENVENLEFVQNQEVLPSEPLTLDPSVNDQLRYMSQPGSVVTKHGVGHVGGGGLNIEALDAALYPIRSDSVSSSYSSKSHRSLSGMARPQDLTSTFIQQEVGKPEDEPSGSFFKQIDSSPIGGEVTGTTVSPKYQSNLSQPSTPSPPKPVGIFQTSANSSFEPVKSHLIGMKPVEADRANVVGEVRGTLAHHKQRRPAAAPPDASPGNLEQPPDNMETLFTPQVCPQPLTSPVEPTHGPQHVGGSPLETPLPTPEKRHSNRVHGVLKCESPATSLWAQNELPDFGGNVVLAPAAPILHVPAKLQSPEVIQPPDEGVSSRQSQQPDPVPALQSGDSSGASENLENPPKMGEEDTLLSQVMKDAQDQSGLERTQQEPVPPSSQGPKTRCPDPSSSGSPLAQGQSQNSAQPPANATPGDTDQQPLPRPPPSSSASVLSTGSSHTAVRSEQQWTQSPPPEYYYYRSMYDGYQSQCPSLYPPDASTGSLYYQDVYSMYDPRYRAYDSTASAYAENYRYSEPERPSSRASHCSDRPHARREYPEGYYNSKSGWSSQSDYYANYYSGQYEYGDAGRWDRYHYSARFRDPRHYDQRYWYDCEHDPYKKESYYHSDRHDKYDDLWRYDPRITGSFDEDPEPRRDPYGEEADRRSVHSEHSAQSLRSAASLHSHRSSFSSQSHQSQIYRSHNVAASTYEAPPPPGSFHGDYPYNSYGGHFNGAQEFSEYSYAPDTSWPTADHVPSRPTTPEKFSVPHVCARFGPGGHLIKVIANLPSEGQPALVEIHSMETLLQHTPEQEEMRAFPGPLGKDDTHKVDVINFAQNKATKCLQNENLIDKESASLLWSFIVLLCRQNGTVVGTDIAELLLRDHKTVWLPGKSPNEANLIDFTNEAVEQVEEEESGEAQLSFLTDNLTATTSILEKEIERFRELLLYGRKKDALESAMKNALWGHALLLASKMDSRTHARVMTRFANSLPINDPLQTVYQLMSGRMPAASTCCGDEKWGDWRPHLAMVLSNLSNNMDVESRTMVTMGDTLASKGLLDAAHFCYLMAQVGFGVYTKKTTKLVLIGSNHSLPFLKFASNEAIQRTEAYEYAQSLGAQTSCLPNFQVFKFIYSCRLAEMGLATQAFHYCEVIAKSILAQPHQFSAVLISQLIQIASQLRLFDPQLKEKPEEEAFQEPSWLVQLQHVEKQIKEGNVVWTQDSAFPQQCPSTPNSEVGQCESQELAQPVGLGTDNPLLAPPVPGSEPFNQSVQLLPSAPQMLSNVQLANPAGMPVFPILLPSGPVEPGPISAPLGSALAYPETSGPSLATLYPGPGLPPGTSSLPEPRSLEPGMIQEVPDRKPLSEPREGNFGGNFTNLGPSGMPQDSEQDSTWEPPPPAPAPAPEVKRPGQASKKEPKEPKKSSEPWFFSRWLSGKKRTEAYLPDDKNKSIVWDEKKNRWVDMNEPEEEKKVPPPPPAAIPKAPQAMAPGPGGPLRPSVNMFSRKAAGNKARYVDILNPAGTQRSEPVLAPASFLAPLAPLPIPAHLMGPSPETEVLSAEGAGREGQIPAGGQEPASEAKAFSSAASLPGSELPPPGVDGSQGGELSRCSSMSSLSREVSQHFNQAPSDPPALGPPPGGAVPFYNPAQFVPTTATSGNSRTGRIGQRKYPALS